MFITALIVGWYVSILLSFPIFRLISGYWSKPKWTWFIFPIGGFFMGSQWDERKLT